MSSSLSKIVVFDIDETLGYFTEFGIFWDSLKSFMLHHKNDTQITQDIFNACLDLYPEFIRPNIIPILTYLKHKKAKNHCTSIMIYTNNQGPPDWVPYIKAYFESKVKTKLFDHIISAFKVHGKQIEICRSSHHKSFNDLIKCSKIPTNTQICFVDDVYYPEMNYDNIYYIKVKSYIHMLSYDDIIERFIGSNICKEIVNHNEHFINFMKIAMKRYTFHYTQKSKEEYGLDKIISKKIMVHIQLFFNKKNIPPMVAPHNNKTRKTALHILNKNKNNGTRSRKI